MQNFKSEDEKAYYYFQKLGDKIMSVSKPIGKNKDINGNLIRSRVRAVSMKLGLSSDLKMEKRVETKNGIEIDLKTTDKAEQEVKAYFYEDSKNVQTLRVQRWMTKTGNPHKESMVLYGEQLDLIIKFVEAFKGVPLGEGSVKIPLEIALQKIEKQSNTDKEKVIKYLQENPIFFKSIIENEIEESDLVSIGYRKKQLNEFEKLLNDSTVKEADWQKFFEKNTWIFGYGLSYIFQTSLDNKKIEQVVQGFDFNSIGKRVDGLLKTSGMINSLCFIEIKTHNTELLYKKAYRKGCWSISNELSGAVSQIQNTVSLATHKIYDKIQLKDNNGDLTGEEIFNFQPKSFLIIGKLDEFKNEYGVNSDKYRSFELFRKNIVSPEIITFDELYERAKYIVNKNDNIEFDMRNDDEHKRF